MASNIFALGLLVMVAVHATAADVPVTYSAAKLSGKNNVPSVTTKAHGSAFVTIFNSSYAVGTFAISDIKNVFMAHIHVGAEGVNGPPVIWAFNMTVSGNPNAWQPMSVNDGTLRGTYAFNPATAGVGEALASGNAYFNVHTTQNPGGEIRAQFVKAKV